MDDPPDCEPDWDGGDDLPGHIHPDLQGQGLTAYEMCTITDIPITGSYL